MYHTPPHPTHTALTHTSSHTPSHTLTALTHMSSHTPPHTLTALTHISSHTPPHTLTALTHTCTTHHPTHSMHSLTRPHTPPHTHCTHSHILTHHPTHSLHSLTSSHTPPHTLTHTSSHTPPHTLTLHSLTHPHARHSCLNTLDTLRTSHTPALMYSVTGAGDSPGGPPVSQCGRHPRSNAVHRSEHTAKEHAICECNEGAAESSVYHPLHSLTHSAISYTIVVGH